MSTEEDLQALPTEDNYYDLGSYTCSITTTYPKAQTWFNRGLIWGYSFHHEEATACFERAIGNDPTCAMAYWGVAYSLGPNYNKPWDFFDGDELDCTVKRTHRAVQQAIQHAGNASGIEKALIDALQYRYPDETPAKDLSIWNEQYADAMKKVYQEFPADLDVAALYADSLMNLTPWALWDLRTGEPASNAHTLEIKSVLDKAIALPGGDSHPHLLHLYIHLMEMSPHPEAAVANANKLRGLVPDSGHLNHMPTHLDILCGDYANAMKWNETAMIADEKYLLRAGPLNFYTLYRCHDYHFRIYAAMFAGNYAVAISTVEKLESSLPDELLRLQSPPMADWLESFGSVRVHVLVRFGKWEDLMQMSLPDDEDLCCVTTAFVHYGRGVAYAALGNVEGAEKEQAAFLQALRKVKESRTLFNNKATDLLQIAKEMLAGEIEYRKSSVESAFEHLRRAIDLDDNLPYDEPWGWMQPSRHAYGALLLEQGKVEDAAKFYSADLGYDDTLPRALRHPNNIWALSGYEECMRRLGREEDAEKIRAELKAAQESADVEVKTSCFCRRGDRRE